MSEVSGTWIRNGSQLSSLQVVLDSWVAECRRYGEIVDDHCWWHNERANVSILAIAAGRANWAAIEEFGTEKKGKRAAKAEGYGRCDLFLCSPRHRIEFAIEAKVAWQRLSDESLDSGHKIGADLEKIDQQWTHAWSDAGALYKDEADHRLAALFVVPYADQGEFDSSALIGYVKRLPGIDACAYYFCDAKDFLKGSSGHFYPGVILAMRHRKRSTSDH